MEKSLSIRAGSSKISEGGQVVGVKQIVQHVDYKPKVHDFDFSLLELEQELNLTDKIQIIPVAYKTCPFPDNSTCLVSGWGINSI